MRWYASGTEAPPGRYLQPRSMQIRKVERMGAAFPFVLVAAALAGLAYVVLLPLLGLALLLRILVRETGAAFRHATGARRQGQARGR